MHRSFRLLPLILLASSCVVEVRSFASAGNSHRFSGLSHRLRATMKGVVYIATSLDGYIATKDGGIEFLDKYQQPPAEGEEPDMSFFELIDSVDCIIMGRNTFDKVVSFGADMWPYGKKPLVVWTRNPDAVTVPEHCRDFVTASSLDPVGLMDQLKSEKGYSKAYVDGGATIQRFLEAGQIHKMILTRVPLLLGDGIPLFGVSNKQFELEHAMTKSMPSGLVTSTYTVKV